MQDPSPVLAFGPVGGLPREGPRLRLFTEAATDPVRAPLRVDLVAANKGVTDLEASVFVVQTQAARWGVAVMLRLVEGSPSCAALGKHKERGRVTHASRHGAQDAAPRVWALHHFPNTRNTRIAPPNDSSVSSLVKTVFLC